ncbi:4Fe-4S ferredoxin [candidate division TA06 bacterium B3_TA06]|uniref:4Fe-4S ferredoxin n=1 Tax=candidate division TA06 bacterium B3_TA06 TaxID=2012487 RepID=A0A532V823_UNCT6|nr:MAG: 4Fe-4S ferredoxin [candidate division TA06 bacterium B3_TA06]
MSNLTEAIREQARKILADKKIDLVIGYAEGDNPMRTQLVFIDKVEDIDKLVWPSFGLINLANYLLRYKNTPHKIGIVAKGCDSRSIVALLKENQIDRDRLYIIGVNCPGMLSRQVAREKVGEIITAEDKGDGNWKLTTVEGTKEISCFDLMPSNCVACRHHAPVISDVIVGDPVTEPEGDGYDDIREFEQKSPAERHECLKQEMANCIRCYACRQACPTCNCDECFVDVTQPKWVDKGVEPTDVAIWQLIRTYHQAGRCVDCGACEEACPAGVKLLWLTRKMNLVVRERFGFEAGVDPEALPPLATYKKEDPQEFIL